MICKHDGCERTARPNARQCYSCIDNKYKYSMTTPDRDRMLAEQDYKCKICNKLTEFGRTGKAVIDHCHVTNEVRGILCHHCNAGIGMLDHSELILKSAIKYLRRSK